MNQEELQKILEAHRKWLRGEEDATRAKLTGADLTGANLYGADLTGADLYGADLTEANLYGADLYGADLARADLTEANLYGADLTGANLYGADLTGANLYGADLTGADLTGADLTGADLTGTCLDPAHLTRQRAFVRSCPPLRTGGRIVYRTLESQHVGDTTYVPGRTYVAPWLSFSAETACHPGIYAGSLKQIRKQYPNAPLARCYVRDGDWTICEKGIRCARLRVLGYVEEACG